MGRHVSSGRRRSLRGRFLLALLAIIVLICVAVFAAYRIWEHSREHPAPQRGPRGSVTTSATPSPTATPAGAVTLALTVTGPSCQVFIRVPDGDILVNRSLARGQSVRLDEQRLSIVLGDASAVRVYVNGKLRPPGKPGQRVTFTALKG